MFATGDVDTQIKWQRGLFISQRLCTQGLYPHIAYFLYTNNFFSLLIESLRA